MFKNVLFTFTFLAFVGCVSNDTAVTQTHEKLAQVNTNIAKLERSLAAQIAENCQQDDKQLVAQLATLMSNDRYRQTENPVKEIEGLQGCSNKNKTGSIGEKLILGEAENIYFIKEKTTLRARVDTGAETSSLGVYKIARFERDGKKWVKFSLSDTDGAAVYRYPIFDSVIIKQESDEKGERRREIKIDIKMGGKKYRNQVFNLADRSHLEFPVLIGRNFLRDIAIVDVSSSHLLGGN